MVCNVRYNWFIIYCEIICLRKFLFDLNVKMKVYILFSFIFKSNL